jgi:hypothetical protein
MAMCAPVSLDSMFAFFITPLRRFKKPLAGLLNPLVFFMLLLKWKSRIDKDVNKPKACGQID